MAYFALCIGTSYQEQQFPEKKKTSDYGVYGIRSPPASLRPVFNTPPAHRELRAAGDKGAGDMAQILPVMLYIEFPRTDQKFESHFCVPPHVLSAGFHVLIV